MKFPSFEDIKDLHPKVPPLQIIGDPSRYMSVWQLSVIHAIFLYLFIGRVFTSLEQTPGKGIHQMFLGQGFNIVTVKSH